MLVFIGVILTVALPGRVYASGIDLVNESTGLENHQQVLQAWQQRLPELEQANDVEGQVRIYQRMGSVYQAMADYSKALQALEKANGLVKNIDNPSLQYTIRAHMASLHVIQGDIRQAQSILQESLLAAKQLQDIELQAAILNDYGNALAVNRDPKVAVSYYYQSLALAEEHGLAEQRLRVLANLTAINAQNQNYEQVLNHARQVVQLTAESQMSQAGIDILLHIAEVMLSVQEGAGEQRSEFLKTTYSSLTKASNYVESTKNQRQHSYVLGLLGWLYYANGDRKQARGLMQRASFHAQQADASDLLYRWQWQLGRWSKHDGNKQQALVHYRNARQAFDKLNPLFTWTYVNPDYSDDSPMVFHYELADLLLQMSSTEQNDDKASSLLYEARQTIEGLRSAELQDYFRDSCISRTRKQMAGIDQTTDKASLVVYPLVFPDRLELLVSRGNQITRYTSNVGSEQLKSHIFAFRNKLEKRRTREYLPHAQQLYDWLIRPLDQAKRFVGIETIVLVPDLALRGLPFAALHDGKQFLVERIAIATSPGLQLTDQRPLTNENVSILLAGLTEPVQGFPALVHVGNELDSIRNIYQGEVLLNRDFKRQQVNRKLSAQQFNIAHIASHGEFRGDVNKSYIVTYDDKMTMNDLSSAIGSTRFRPQAIELLTLSACFTAAGDDRAALGLAGITVKAGARSVLATLWPINDQATAELMTAFYNRLKQTRSGKAQALREAQVKLLQDKRYRHPGYWSPFLLIGNWL